MGAIAGMARSYIVFWVIPLRASASAVRDEAASRVRGDDAEERESHPVTPANAGQRLR